jgi:hypothetical protein
MIGECRSVSHIAAALIAFALGSADAAAVPLTADVSVTGDDAGGVAIDTDFSISPTERLTLNLGAGHSSSSEEAGHLRGTLLNAGASLHGERAGVALGYDLFDDSTNYRAATVAARAWLAAGDFEFALLGRHRDLSVELTLVGPRNTARRNVDFTATGGGLQLTFSRESFSAYAMAIEYEYDDELANFLALVDSPLLEERPRIEALLSSFLTQAQGTIDRQMGFGIERSFGRNSLALDFSSVHDAIVDASSNSVALSYRRAQAAHMDWGVSAGMADSAAYGSIAFLGVSLGLAN